MHVMCGSVKTAPVSITPSNNEGASAGASQEEINRGCSIETWNHTANACRRCWRSAPASWLSWLKESEEMLCGRGSWKVCKSFTWM